MAEVHLHDVGSVFEPQIRDEQENIVAIGGATVLRLRMRKPNGTLVTKACTLSSDGSDGTMRYFPVYDDLDQVGIWRLEGYVELPAGKWTTDQHRVRVYANLAQASDAMDLTVTEGLPLSDTATSELA